MNLPGIKTRFSQWTIQLSTTKEICAQLDADLQRCVNRHGGVLNNMPSKKDKSGNKCYYEQEDLHECIYNRKAIERVKIIREERKRQGLPPNTVESDYETFASPVL